MGEVPYPEESITRLQPFPPHVSKTAVASAFLLVFSFSVYSSYACVPEVLICLLQGESELLLVFEFEQIFHVCCINMSTGA